MDGTNAGFSAGEHMAMHLGPAATTGLIYGSMMTGAVYYAQPFIDFGQLVVTGKTETNWNKEMALAGLQGTGIGIARGGIATAVGYGLGQGISRLL